MGRRIKDSPYRKEKWQVVNSESNTLLTSMGKVTYTRTRFRIKADGHISILTDEHFEIESYARMTEDVVTAQFWTHKGDLRTGERGYKNNTIIPTLIYVYEGIEKQGPKSKLDQTRLNHNRIKQEVLSFAQTYISLIKQIKQHMPNIE